MIALAAVLAAQMPPIGIEPQDTIIRLAFDPVAFFGDARHSLVEIQYFGDDEAWPVYAIAIRKGCAGNRGPDCRSTLIARMVRAPGATTAERPRRAGAALVSHVERTDAATPGQVAAVLDTLDLEWREADLSACPAAMTVLPEVAKAEWVPPAAFQPGRRQPIELFLHFDKVSVTYSGDYTRKTTYYGRIAKHLPSGWAVRLAAALEPCWRPATAEPPWRRVLTPPPSATPASPPPP